MRDPNYTLRRITKLPGNKMTAEDVFCARHKPVSNTTATT